MLLLATLCRLVVVVFLFFRLTWNYLHCNGKWSGQLQSQKSSHAILCYVFDTLKTNAIALHSVFSLTIWTWRFVSDTCVHNCTYRWKLCWISKRRKKKRSINRSSCTPKLNKKTKMITSISDGNFCKFLNYIDWLVV